jgi:hypothetical protein
LPSLATVTCETTGGPPGEQVTVRLDILSPADGSVLAPTSGCGAEAVITGTWAIDAPGILWDFYLVIDSSSSTSLDSGTDVNGDGWRRTPGDSVYQAELAAAQAFVRALDPALSRAAVIAFDERATVHQRLTADLAAVDASLEAMKALTPLGGTRYVPALQAVDNEVVRRGDRCCRQQRALFLSDGQPQDAQVDIDQAARDLAADRVVVDTFGLGSPWAASLRRIADLTGGAYTDLAVPGDIVVLLPGAVPYGAQEWSCVETRTASSGEVIADDLTETFEARIWLDAGSNHVVVTLVTRGTSVVTLSCAVDVIVPQALAANAGPDVISCGGGTVTMDGSASAFVPCARPTYRWLDCTGTEVCPASPDPTCVVPAGGPCADWTLELGCEGEGCFSRDVAHVDSRAAVIAPFEGGACPDEGVLLSCGTPLPDAWYWWDVDAARDADGDGDAANDPDLMGCDVEARFAVEGAHAISGWSADREGCVLRIAAGVLTVAAGAVPGEVTTLRVARGGDSVQLAWRVVAGASSYRVARGTLQSLWLSRAYDHAADDLASQGQCDTYGAVALDDPDDAAVPEGFYYLVGGSNACASDGPLGFGWDGHVVYARPPRAATGACP